MSLGSPADIIPFKRFLDCRQRRHRMAATNGTVVTPASTDVGIQPEATGIANADYGASPRCITDRPRGDAARRHGHRLRRSVVKRSGCLVAEALSTVKRRWYESK
jgi:hypothetical protein